MDKKILERLRTVSDEEEAILNGCSDIERSLYTDRKDFVIDSSHLLPKGKLIDIRPHTRFTAFPKHRHNYVEMVYMLCGSTTHIINGNQKVVLEEGDLLFLNQNAIQEVQPAGEEDIAINFIILPEFFDKTFSMIEPESVLRDFLISTLARDSTSADYLHFKTRDILPVRNLAENMIWILAENRPGSGEINRTTMGLLFMTLSAFAENIECGSPEQYEQTQVLSVLRYIEERYRDGTLAEIAERLHQQSYQLSRLLKKHTGCNFKELLQQKKLSQAAYLLRQTPLTVDRVIEAVGYDNSSYFYRKFKEIYGYSPREYRG